MNEMEIGIKLIPDLPQCRPEPYETPHPRSPPSSRNLPRRPHRNVHLHLSTSGGRFGLRHRSSRYVYSRLLRTEHGLMRRRVEFLAFIGAVPLVLGESYIIIMFLTRTYLLGQASIDVFDAVSPTSLSFMGHERYLNLESFFPGLARS
jgi:hypothetical protein